MISEDFKAPAKDAAESTHTLKPQSIFWLCLSLGVSLRLWLSTLGHNFDLESYWLVSELVEGGRSVYAETYRYNYGPIWFLLLKLLREITRLTTVDDIFHLHVVIAVFLTLVDATIGMSLKYNYGLKVSLFFILNPVSILITGYHSQFDNLAILIGWIACCHLSRSEGKRMRELTIGALLLGLSLATKHILLFFPFWMWLLHSKSSPKVRAIVCVVPWLTFLVCFVPFLSDNATITGIIDNVFRYNSFRINGLIAGIAHAAADWGFFDSQLEVSLAQLAFVMAVILSGPLWISARKHPKRAEELMLLYLISLTAFSSGMAHQYLAIPLIALARYCRTVFAWAYSGAVTFLLLTGSEGVFGERFTNMQFVSYPDTQILLILVLVAVWRGSSSGVRTHAYDRHPP